MPDLNELEFIKRNLNRFEKNGKKLPDSLFHEMTAIYEEVSVDEEFELIIKLLL
jgi:hypothetical protein